MGGKWRNMHRVVAPQQQKGRLSHSAAAQRKQSGDYYVPIFGRLFGAQSATIRGLGGKTCHCTGYGNIGACEYDGLVVTLGWGRETDR